MLTGLSASEYAHWQAIYSVEPFPEERADLRTAEVIQALMLGRVKQLPNISDLVHDYWGEAKSREQSPAQMKANMDIIKAASKQNKTRK